MAERPMEHFTVDGVNIFEITDAKARQDCSDLKDDKANIDGYYENMSVGNAEQLASTVFTDDSTPYLFRTTGGSADVGDREYVDAIVGATVAWNQLLNPQGNTVNGVTVTVADGEYTFSGNGESVGGRNVKLSQESIPIVSGHKYLLLTSFDKTIFNNICITLTSDTSQLMQFVSANIVSASYSGASHFGVNVMVRTYSESGNFTITDLTQTFGPTIADYIYGLETANAGAGVAWFKKLFPNMDAEYSDNGVTKKLRDYQPGTLISVGGVYAHKTVGFNAWDEQWEVGRIDVNTGQNQNATGVRSKNYIPVVPSTTYYVKAPRNVYVIEYDADKNYIRYASYYQNEVYTTSANAHYIRFYNVEVTTYNNDICINLSWDGEKNGTYEPYVEHTYPLDADVVLRGIPKLDSSNNLYYDGDEYTPDGAVNIRYGIVDLGTLNWSKYAETTNIPVFYTSNDIPGLKPGSGDNAVCDRYVCRAWSSLQSRIDKCVEIHPTIARPYISDSSYTDAESFKAAMSGVLLVYELATPTTETAEPYQQTQICDDFGTEEFVSTSPVPVGHNTRYAPNLRAKLEMSPDSPDGDGVYVVQQSNGENAYIPLGSTTVIQDILSRLTALENA